MEGKCELKEYSSELCDPGLNFSVFSHLRNGLVQSLTSQGCWEAKMLQTVCGTVVIVWLCIIII